MINRDGAWPLRFAADAIEELDDNSLGHPLPRFNNWSRATLTIDDRQDSKWPPVGERIMHKIQTPTLAGTSRHRCGAAMQGHVFAPPHAHPQLKSIQAVQPTDSLPIHEPALSPPTPRCAGTQSAVEPGKNPECAGGAPIDPSLDFGDTTRLG